MIRAVIFDLDGTLADTKGDIAAAMNRALTKYGLPPRKLGEYGRIIGGGILNAIRLAAPPGTPDEVIRSVNDAYQQDYPVNCSVSTQPYPGMAEALAALRNRGLRLAVITNKTDATAKAIVSRLFPGVPFEFVWGNDGKRPLKPAPDAGRLAAEALALHPSEIAYVGDSDTDIFFALDAELVPVGAAWGYRGYDELAGAGAGLLADTPAQLQSLL